jgi:hypothetical protein
MCNQLLVTHLCHPKPCFGLLLGKVGRFEANPSSSSK